MGDSENKELVGQDEPKKTGNVENEPKKMVDVFRN